MNTIDEREIQKPTKQKQKKAEKSKGGRSYRGRGRDKWFWCVFKLGSLQLICKASLIFKSSLELGLSIILKQKELYDQSMFKNMRLVILFDMLLNPSFKMTTSSANVARTIVSKSKIIY